ncbi:MAG: glycosyltransferase family 4 protein [Kiritimatiellia bacterium]|nr:glycosyltransferase family 4 protein [Kiritimatiellia bacterium]
MTQKKKIVWLCGLPDQIRTSSFADLGLPAGHAWSWVTAHLPPPPEIELHLVCPDRRVRENTTRTWGGAQIHVIKVPRGGSYLMYRGWIPALKAKIRELDPDVVHSWGTECGFAVAALSAAPRNHVIGIQGILAVTWPFMEKRPELLLSVLNERSALRRARYCVAESEYSRGIASRYTSARVDIVPHPLRKEFLDTEAGPRNEKLVLYLGVLARRKGFFDAVTAFLSRDSDWKLVCIGTAGSLKEQAEVESFLEANQAANRVLVTGSQNPGQIIEWFKKSPLFLLPSYTDTGPTALKEALSMGLWPVCYDNTGPKELIERYGVGTLVPTGDIQGLGRVLHDHLAAAPWKGNESLRNAACAIRADLSPLPVWKGLIKTYLDSTDIEIAPKRR